VEFKGKKLVDEEALHVVLNNAVFRGGSVSKSGSKPNLIQLQLKLTLSLEILIYRSEYV
jgi:hypothetical protein